jgi:hypothetical protein
LVWQFTVLPFSSVFVELEHAVDVLGAGHALPVLVQDEAPFKDVVHVVSLLSTF